MKWNIGTSAHRNIGTMAGMTLMEVLIGISILAVITTAVAQISWLMTKGRQRIERRATQYHAAQVALEKIASDVSMAFLVQAPQLKGTNAGAPVLETSFRGSDHGEEDELDFTGLCGRRFVAGAPESDQREVGYRVNTIPDSGGRKELTRRESRWIDGDVREGGETFTVVEGVKAFQLEYYDAEKGEWDSEWDSTERMRQGKLPAAVKITLKLEDPNNKENELTFATVARIGLAPGPMEF